MNYSPSYLIKNRYGIFYFQYRIPTRLLAYSKGQKLIRLSLRTRILRDELKQARMLIIQSESGETQRSLEFQHGWNHGNLMNHLIAKETWLSLELEGAGDSHTKMRAAQRVLEHEDPDLVILVDDGANEHIGRSLAREENRKLFFVSIDQHPNYYGYEGKDQIRGIGEHLRLEPIHELMGSLKPGEHLKYGALGFDNPSGRARLEQLKERNWDKHHLEATELVSDFDAWMNFINIHPDLDVLVILNTESMPEIFGNGAFIRRKDVIDWTEKNSKGLPVSVDASYVENGGAIAFELSPNRLGEFVSKRAKEWLEPAHRVPDAIEHLTEFDLAVSVHRMAVRDIKLPAIYKESARLAQKLYP